MLELRHARATDADAIASLTADIQALHAQALPHLFPAADAKTFPAEAVRGMFDNPDRVVLVACDEGAIVGYASAQVERREATPFRYAMTFPYVQLMGVSVAARRRGVGRALVSALRSEAAERGITSVLLDVWAFNEEARGFYEAVGFHPQRHIMALELGDGDGSLTRETTRTSREAR